MKTVPDDQSVIVVATGQYIGEGFNFPRLDTMMLMLPGTGPSGVPESWEHPLFLRDYQSRGPVYPAHRGFKRIQDLQPVFAAFIFTYNE